MAIENGTNRNVDPAFLFDVYTHQRPILHRLATIHNAADSRQMTDERQTEDKAIGRIGCLCNIMGGLILYPEAEPCITVWDRPGEWDNRRHDDRDVVASNHRHPTT